MLGQLHNCHLLAMVCLCHLQKQIDTKGVLLSQLSVCLSVCLALFVSSARPGELFLETFLTGELAPEGVKSSR